MFVETWCALPIVVKVRERTVTLSVHLDFKPEFPVQPPHLLLFALNRAASHVGN